MEKERIKVSNTEFTRIVNEKARLLKDQLKLRGINMSYNKCILEVSKQLKLIYKWDYI